MNKNRAAGMAAIAALAAGAAGPVEPEYPGDKYETIMDGVAMDVSPQDLLNKIGHRGLTGWQLRACLPVVAPTAEPLAEGQEPQMVWGMIYQRVKSALVLARV